MKNFFDYHFMLAFMGVLFLGYGSPTQAQDEQRIPSTTPPLELERTSTSTTPQAEGKRPQLGVWLKSDTKGVVIQRISLHSAAAKAGLLTNDEILKINKKHIRTVEQLQEAIKAMQVGDVVRIKYKRGKKTRRTKAKLQTKQHRYTYHYSRYKEKKQEGEVLSPSEKEAPCASLQKIEGEPFLGIYMHYGHAYSKGVFIRSIVKNTAAERYGLQAGDVIVQMDGETIKYVKDVKSYILSLQPGDPIVIKVERAGGTQIIQAKIGSKADYPDYQKKIEALRTLCTTTPPSEPKSNKEGRAATTNLPRIEAAVTVQLFPNPTTDYVNVQYQGSDKPLQIAVLTLDGKQMMNQTIAEGADNYQGQLDVSSYPAGIYLVQFAQGDKKVVKQVVIE